MLSPSCIALPMVRLPTFPSGSSPFFSWNSIVASRVFGPKSPSTSRGQPWPMRKRCHFLTVLLREPILRSFMSCLLLWVSGDAARNEPFGERLG